MRIEEIIEHTPPGEVDALLLDIGAKNTVRVTLHKAGRAPHGGYQAYRKVLDEMGEVTLHEGWERTIILGPMLPNRHVNIRLDADVLDWFR